MTACTQKYSPKWRLLLLAVLIAIISPIPYAGSWNDGSRLASVESLVDHHTWSIDQSVFVVTPGVHTRFTKPDALKRMSAWPPNDQLLQEHGTLDKLFINHHYYSDKSPVPSLVMAGVYKVLQLVSGLTAAENPALFCYLLTLFFSGTAYVVSVACMAATASALDLRCLPRLLISYSFALCTVALPYARQVNNHILLLAVFSVTMLFALKYAQAEPGKILSRHLPALGTLAGIGYTIDLGAGPILVLAVTGFVVMQSRSAKAVFILLATAFPWFLFHHILNYRIGGAFKPANAIPDYFLWPGCPFNASNLTGGWAHKNVAHFVIYSLDMLFGKKGFVGHNPALYLSIPAIGFLLRKKEREASMIYLSLALIVGTWLIYAATSNNYSGLCCSIRWFVPLLAPFYYLLALFLKRRPDFSIDLLILTGWGLVLGILMWIKGPWVQHMIPLFWPLQAAALVSWAVYRLFFAARRRATANAPRE